MLGQQAPTGMRGHDFCFPERMPFPGVVTDKSGLLAYPRTRVLSVIPEQGGSIWEPREADPPTAPQNC